MALKLVANPGRTRFQFKFGQIKVAEVWKSHMRRGDPAPYKLSIDLPRPGPFVEAHADEESALAEGKRVLLAWITAAELKVVWVQKTE